MSKRENVQVSEQEITQQKEYIKSLKLMYQTEGKKPLAMVATYGCQQNENDSERMKGMLSEMGFDFTEDKTIADFILFNTCAVREGAELKVFGKLGALKHEKARRPELIVGICGCMMQQEHIVKQIKSKYKHVDVVFGTHTLYRFPQILFDAVSEHKRVIDVENIDGRIAEDIPVYREGNVKAWVSVMYGCNNFCTYCIVPYVRGRERSRKSEDILAEVRDLVQKGVKEITLLGQNVNSYGKDLDENIEFADLLKMVNEVHGIKRIRFVTSHPKDMNDKLIETMASCDKLCHQLHLPFQAGSDNILKAMNRRYTKEHYLGLIDKVRKAIPDMSFSADVIVGFPNETEEDFAHTMDVLEKVRFDTIFSFIYSKRSGTPAAIMEDKTTDEQKHDRFNRMLELQNQISKELNDEYRNRTVEVLVEGTSKNDETMLTGRTDSNKVVNFPYRDTIKAGDFVNIKITKTNTWSLMGEVEE